MKKKIIAYPLAFLAILGLASCGKDDVTTSTVPTAETTPEPTVVENLRSIRLTTTDVKLNYVVGEELNLTGLVVTASYIDGTEADVTSKVVINTSTFDSSKAGTYFLRVTYTEDDVVKSRSITVNVKSILDSVNYLVGITCDGAKTDYVYQDVIDLTGLVVTAHYKDNTEKILSSSEYTINTDAFNSEMRGNYEIPITYKETYSSGSSSESVEVKTCFFASVNMNIESMSVLGKYTFYQYQDINIDDWRLRINYEEGVSETITSGFETNIHDLFPDSNTPTNSSVEVTVSYTYNGKTTTCTKSIEIRPASQNFLAGALTVGGIQNIALAVDSTFTIQPGYSISQDQESCGTQLFSKCVNLNNTGSRDENSIKFVTTGSKPKVDICISSEEGATFGVYTSEGNPVKTYTVGTTIERFTFDLPTSGTYYVWASTAVGIYYIGIWN